MSSRTPGVLCVAVLFALSCASDPPAKTPSPDVEDRSGSTAEQVVVEGDVVRVPAAGLSWKVADGWTLLTADQLALVQQLGGATPESPPGTAMFSAMKAEAPGTAPTMLLFQSQELPAPVSAVEIAELSGAMASRMDPTLGEPGETETRSFGGNEWAVVRVPLTGPNLPPSAFVCILVRGSTAINVTVMSPDGGDGALSVLEAFRFDEPQASSTGR